MSNPHNAIANSRVPIDSSKYLPAAMTVTMPAGVPHDTFVEVKNTSKDGSIWIVDAVLSMIESPLLGSMVTGQVGIIGAYASYTWRYDLPQDTWRLSTSHVPFPHEEIYTWKVVEGWEVFGSGVLLTPTASGLRAELADEQLSFRAALTAEVTLPSNNTDTVYRWAATVTGGTLNAQYLYGAASGPRAVTLLDTRSGPIIWTPAAVGDVIEVDTEHISGTGTESRDGMSLIVRIS